MSFSPDGRRVAAFGEDGMLRVWQAHGGRLVDQVEVDADGVSALVFSPDGTLLYTAGTDRAIRVWDVSGKHRFLPRVEVVNPRTSGPSFTAVIPAPDGSRVLTAWAGRDTWVNVLDPTARTVTAAINTRHGQYGWAAWHPSGDTFATTGGDGVVRAWDARTGRLVVERKVSDVHLSGVTYVGDGETVAVSNHRGEVYALDAETLQRVGPVLSASDQRISNVFAARGTTSVLALTGVPLDSGPAFSLPPERGWVVLDLETGEVTEGIAPVHFVAGAGLSHDGDALALSGVLGDLAFVDTATGDSVLTAERPQTGGGTPVFSVDGETVVSGGSDGSVSLWDVSSGEPLGTVRAAAGTRATATWLPDSRTVLIATYDGQVFTWDTDPESWVDAACGIARRDLTDDEWAEAFGDRPYADPCPT